MILAILGLGAVSFFLSWVLTFLMIRIAPTLGFVDKPGGRKIHDNPKPLGGGVAIVGSFALPLLAILVFVRISRPEFINPDYWNGVRLQTPMALTFIGIILLLHALGLLDDRKALGPFVKLIVQLICAATLSICFRETRILTALGTAPSIILATLWIVGITNAFNFLDNMDGLALASPRFARRRSS